MSQFPMDFATLYGLYQQRRMMNQPSPLAAAYNQQFNMGNYNNEARYGDIIGGRTGIYDRNMERINSLGAQEREDINRRADQMLSSQRSDLVSRGLGGTTVRQSIENKNLEDRNRALRQQSDQEVRQRIATDSSLADNVYATMERRNDITPDLGQLAQLQQAVGASGMYGQYPGYSGPGMRGVYPDPNQPRMVTMPMPGAGGRPQNGIPRPSIGNMGPGSITPADPSRPPNGATPFPGGGYTYQGRPPSSGPIAAPGGVQRPVTMPGTGGSAGGYPLPGGGTSTPTYMPQPFPGPGGVGGGYGGGQLPPGYKPYDGKWGYIMPGGGNRLPGQAPPDPALMISKYSGGDRVGSAIESQLLNRIKGYSGISDRSGNRYGQPQQQSGGMIRTAGDISRTPQQQINDYMQNRMRDNVYGINPNPTFKGMGGPPTFTIGGMPQYMTAQQPLYATEYVDYPNQLNQPNRSAPTRPKTSTPYQVYGRIQAARGRTGQVANQVGQMIGQASNAMPGMFGSMVGAASRAYYGALPKTANDQNSLLQYGPYVA